MWADHINIWKCHIRFSAESHFLWPPQARSQQNATVLLTEWNEWNWLTTFHSKPPPCENPSLFSSLQFWSKNVLWGQVFQQNCGSRKHLVNCSEQYYQREYSVKWNLCWMRTLFPHLCYRFLLLDYFSLWYWMENMKKKWASQPVWKIGVLHQFIGQRTYWTRYCSVCPLHN